MAKHIGIIGGSGPEAGILFAQALVDAKKQMLGRLYKTDKDAPSFTLLSLPNIGGPHLPEEFTVGSTAREELWSSLQSAIHILAPRVDLLCIACNTLHVFEPEIRELLLKLALENGTPCEFVSMVDATLVEIQRQGFDSVRILGSKVTSNYSTGVTLSSDTSVRSPYFNLNEAVKLVPWSSEEKEAMQKLLGLVKREGPYEASVQRLFAELINGSSSPCVLACTEFDLVMEAFKATPGRAALTESRIVLPTLALAKVIIEKSSVP